jgi:murein DD-endopeptidase MepM/ murein hydrolase activator NlpD
LEHRQRAVIPFEPQYPVAAPVRVTQVYGARYDYYMENFGLPGHEGEDYGGKDGDPVFAAESGTVKLIAKDDGKHPYGSHIRITHQRGNDVYETIYAHLRGFVAGIVQGDKVRTGQQIGYLGNTGNSTGPHLHFSLKKNGALVNPAQFLKP